MLTRNLSGDCGHACNRGHDLVRHARELRVDEEDAVGPDERGHSAALTIDAIDVAAELGRRDHDFLLLLRRGGRLALRSRELGGE